MYLFTFCKIKPKILVFTYDFRIYFILNTFKCLPGAGRLRLSFWTLALQIIGHLRFLHRTFALLQYLVFMTFPYVCFVCGVHLWVLIET